MNAHYLLAHNVVWLARITPCPVVAVLGVRLRIEDAISIEFEECSIGKTTHNRDAGRVINRLAPGAATIRGAQSKEGREMGIVPILNIQQQTAVGVAIHHRE